MELLFKRDASGGRIEMFVRHTRDKYAAIRCVSHLSFDRTESFVYERILTK